MGEPEQRMTAKIGPESGHWRETEVKSLHRQREDRRGTPAPNRQSPLHQGLAVMLAGASLLGLLGIAGCQGGAARSYQGVQTQRYKTTPAQHARSQVQWLRARGGELTPEQLHLLQQIPWNAGSDVEEARRRLLERGGEEGDREPEFVRQRVLGRPRVMEAAREAAQEDEDDSP